MSPLAFANQTARLDQPVQEIRHAGTGQGLLEGDRHILMSNVGLAGKEFDQTYLDLRLLSIELPTIRHLVDRKATHLGQQIAVGTEQDAIHTDILAVIVTVLHLDAAL
ncbi:MAG: hypothetical protein II279_02575, partial [Bacteroidaceae bacterium]|nr:hypothetical protein [Bacteroidaceae bacterium]